MARHFRTIKRALIEDDHTRNLSDAAFRLFVSAILLADDYGNLRAELIQLRRLAFPLSRRWQFGTKFIDIFEELILAGLLEPYEIRGQEYAHICNWDKHQNIKRKHRADIPGPPWKEGAKVAQASYPQGANGAEKTPTTDPPLIRDRSATDPPLIRDRSATEQLLCNTASENSTLEGKLTQDDPSGSEIRDPRMNMEDPQSPQGGSEGGQNGLSREADSALQNFFAMAHEPRGKV